MEATAAKIRIKEAYTAEYAYKEQKKPGMAGWFARNEISLIFSGVAGLLTLAAVGIFGVEAGTTVSELIGDVFLLNCLAVGAIPLLSSTAQHSVRKLADASIEADISNGTLVERYKNEVLLKKSADLDAKAQKDLEESAAQRRSLAEEVSAVAELSIGKPFAGAVLGGGNTGTQPTAIERIERKGHTHGQ